MSERSPMIDWDLAVRVGARLSGDGPVVDRAEADAVVAELREGAARSTPYVREFTGLNAPVAAEAPVLVVDRRGWLQANVDGFSQLVSPLIEKLQERKGPPSAMAQAIGSRVTGSELGLMLGFLSGKVLGQYDPFHAADGAVGRLLLVAPNIVQVERELAVDPHDFRLWVCLHEETHRVQFTAVPWLRDHLYGEMRSIIGAIEADPAKVLQEGLKRVGDLVSGKTEGSLLELFSTPEQREVIDRPFDAKTDQGVPTSR